MLAVASKPTQFRHAESMIFQSSFHLSQIFPEDLAHILPTSHNDTHYAASSDREDYFAYEEDIFDSGSQISSKQRSLAAKLVSDIIISSVSFHYYYGYVWSVSHIVTLGDRITECRHDA